MKANESILFVFEDDPVIQWQLQHKFEKLGYDKAKFYDKKSDLNQVIPTEKKGTIFINLKLADGWIREGVFHSVKKDFHKIVVLTGYKNNEFFDSVSKNKNLSFLYKPYSEFQIRTLIESSIN